MQVLFPVLPRLPCDSVTVPSSACEQVSSSRKRTCSGLRFDEVDQVWTCSDSNLRSQACFSVIWQFVRPDQDYGTGKRADWEARPCGLIRAICIVKARYLIVGQLYS